jgi:hypothetical protein
MWSDVSVSAPEAAATPSAAATSSTRPVEKVAWPGLVTIWSFENWSLAPSWMGPPGADPCSAVRVTVMSVPTP